MSRRAPLALLLALAVTTTACAHASPPQRIGMVTTAIGLFVTASAVASVQEDDGGGNAEGNACPDNSCLVTLAVVGTSAALVLIAVMSGTDHGKEPAQVTIAPVRIDGPPGGDGTTGAEPLPRRHRPLPALSTDARTVQLAKQVRSAALAGDCDAVSLTLATIHERDPRYYAALMSSTVIAGCR